MQEIKIWPYEQMVYAQTLIRTEEWNAKFLWGFDMQTDHLISRPENQTFWWLTKKRICRKMNFTVQADHKAKRQTRT